MRQMLKNRLKDQKGFTLIELLAVIVILGIIAAIAIPSILGLINNSKLDAQVANAQQMVSSARNAVASSDVDMSTGTATIKLSELISKGYVEEFTNPTDKTGGYDEDNSKVVITKDGTDTNKLIFTVDLIGKDKTYFVKAKASDAIDRASVKADSKETFTASEEEE